MTKAEGRKQKAEVFASQTPGNAHGAFSGISEESSVKGCAPSQARAFRISSFLLLSAFFLLVVPAAFACPVCFGDSSSNLTMGAKNGILFLLGVIGVVQIGFIALFWSFWRRAKALRERRGQFQLIDGGMQ